MTTETVELSVHREKMLGHLRAGHAYQFLTTADAYLEAVPDDAYLRLMAVREYLNLGLIPPARDLLHAPTVEARLSPELLSLRPQVAALGGRPMRWTDFDEVFNANLAVLKERGISVHDLREAWADNQEDFQLLCDRHGVHQIRRRVEGDCWRWTPYLGNHRAVDDARALPESIASAMPGPFLFVGVGRGGYFQRVYQATKNTFLGYSCALYVVEPDLAALAAVLHLRDWTESLRDERVLLFVGDDWRERLLDAWNSSPDLPLPQHAITCPVVRNCEPPDAESVVSAAAETRERIAFESWTELEKRYAARTLDHWSRRFEEAVCGSGPRLRILAAVSMHTTFLQHSVRDAKRALESLGHSCTVLMEKTPFSITGPLTFHNAIRELDPDLFLILDHIRPEFDGLIPANLPILTWDQDQLPHVLTPAKLKRLAAHDFLVTCAKPRCVAQGCDPRQLLQARVPTCPEQFGGERLTAGETARYTCDVSYVSHASQTPRAFHEQERAGYEDPRLVRLLDRLYEMLPRLLQEHRVVDGGVMAAAITEGCRQVGIAGLDAEIEERLRSWYLWRLGDRMFRHEALEWVGRWARRTGRTFRIYGNGWEKHPTLGEFAAGPAQNGRELVCIYRASRINLQLMPAGFIHQRSLDGLAAGGFFTTRLCPGDLKGRTLRRLDQKIRELGITGTRGLVSNPDPDLRQMLSDYLGSRLTGEDHERHNLWLNILSNAELHFPDEVFGDFPTIVFDTPEQFEKVAESFLADEKTRNAVAERMRRVVVDRFSYRAEMDRFLRAMTAYLRTAAGGIGSQSVTS